MMSFIDEAMIKIQSGKGGSGCLSFASSRRRVLGGPDGGDGGQGGSVFVRVDSKKSSLSHLNVKKIYKAPSGSPGQSQKRKGKKGTDIILDVPPQTRVVVDQKTFFAQDTHLLLKGGKGGRGNFFFKTSQNNSPRKFEKGEEGISKTIYLETRLKADVAFISWLPFSFQENFFNFNSSQNKFIFSQKSPRIQSMISSSQKEISLIELPYLKKETSFLKHALASKIIVFVLELKEWNECQKEFENILKILKTSDSSFLQKKLVCFLNMEYCSSSKEQKKALDFFKQQKINLFSKINLLEKFIETSI